MIVCVVHCVFTLADGVNLCGNSGAAIGLPAPVCSGWTSKTAAIHTCVDVKGFVCLGRKALSLSLALGLL